MQAQDSLSGILGGMLYLKTLDIGMSDEKENLGKSITRVSRRLPRSTAVLGPRVYSPCPLGPQVDCSFRMAACK